MNNQSIILEIEIQYRLLVYIIQLDIDLPEQMDQQKDQREELRKKVKLLEQQIVQRARNYMQSSRIKHKKSSHSNINKCSQKAIQTQTKNSVLQDSNKENHSGNKQKILQQLQNVRNQINEFNAKNFKNSEKNSIQNQVQVKQNVNSLESLLKNVNDHVNQCISMLILAINSQIQNNGNSDQMHNVFSIKSFKNKYLQNLEMLIKEISLRPSLDVKQIQNLKAKLEKRSRKLKQAEVKCQFIAKALNESQQANYELRLQLQDAQIKVRNFIQKIELNKSKADQSQADSQKMKVKIQQMEVMKKQYLRAYSKIKEEKQNLQIQLIDMRQQFQAKLRTKQYFGQPIFQSWGDQSRFSEDQNRLKTIVEHIEDEKRDEIWRRTQTQSCLSAIREIIQHGLMQTNRSTSQKWIKSALLKLQQYEQRQIQESQKQITSQTLIETNIHEKYKNILLSINKLVNNSKESVQSSFNKMMDKLIVYGNTIQTCETKAEEQQKVSKIQKTEIREQTSQVQDSSQNINLQSKVYELVSKLNQSHLKFTELKKKYDTLLQKQQVLQIKNSFNIVHAKIQTDFNSFMSKIIHMQSQNKIKSKNSKFTQEFFDKLSHRVFQTLCNLPTNSHGLMFFVPTNQEQLEDAIQLIYKFSLEYDKIQEAKLKQFKSEALSLTKVLEQIAVANQVPAQMVIESMHNNFAEENTMSGEYVKTLIKKLSSCQSPSKTKSLRTIHIQNQSSKAQKQQQN